MRSILSTLNLLWLWHRPVPSMPVSGDAHCGLEAALVQCDFFYGLPLLEMTSCTVSVRSQKGSNLINETGRLYCNQSISIY